MENLNFFKKFYLDKEKDIIVNLYKHYKNTDELIYIIETPNHGTGNLITNLAKVCNLETTKNINDMKIIMGTIPASLNANNETLFVFNLNGKHIATIYGDGRIEQTVKIPAIIKTLMSQTKDYNLNIDDTLINSYILKKSKFRTDLHTHLYANLPSDLLIAIGIKHQIRYPLYFVKKLDLILSPKQEETISKYRKEIELKYISSSLEGKILERKIDDETYINFAELILNNLENAEYNIRKIRNSLSLVKDGQAVFTNLEKLYNYRYVFQKGKGSKILIDLKLDKINKIPEIDVKNYLIKMLEDSNRAIYKNNTILQDNLLWLGREYQKQGIVYSEIASTDLCKKGTIGTSFLKQIHEILPKVKLETGVDLRFLVAIRRIWLSQKEQFEALEVLKIMAKSPYIVGSDFVGEEITDIEELSPIINELVKYAISENNGFTIRIHAGETDAFAENVGKSIDIILKAVGNSKIIPRCRLGHGLYGIGISPEKDRETIKKIKKLGAVLEFQLSSNVRLNNLTKLENHPIKTYLKSDIKCVQGTDGFGIYGTDTIEEQISLRNLLKISENDFQKMKEVENNLLSENQVYFDKKSKSFKEFLNGRDISDAIIEEEYKSLKSLNVNYTEKPDNKIDSSENLKEKIKELPTNKVPIVIAGGSFNTNGRETVVTEEGKKMLRDLIEKIDSNKAYFVIGHKMQGYEKAVIDISKEMNKKFEIDAIIPKRVNKEVKDSLLNSSIDGIRVSIEPEEVGIYKSFNYEIFERRPSVVVAFDGNSPVSNLVQEAKNGKGKAKIFVNGNSEALKEKAKSLGGYVEDFSLKETISDQIINWNPDLEQK